MAQVRVGVGPRVAEQLAAASLEHLAHLGLVRGRPDPDSRAHELGDEVVRHRAPVRQAARLDPRRTRIRRRDMRPQLGEEPALADPGLAQDRRHAALPRADDRERVAESGELGVTADHRRVHVLAEAAGGHGAAAEPGHLIAVNGLGLALELEAAGVDRLDERSDEAVCRRRDHDAAGRRRGLHPRGDVHGVAHRRVLARDVAPDHPDDDRAGVDADAHLERHTVPRVLLAAEARDLADHVEAAAHRALGVVLVCDRRAEEHEHAVAHEPRDRPAVPRRDGVQPVEGRADELRPVFRVERLRDRGRAGDVREQDGERPALAGRHPLGDRCLTRVAHPSMLDRSLSSSGPRARRGRGARSPATGAAGRPRVRR